MPSSGGAVITTSAVFEYHSKLNIYRGKMCMDNKIIKEKNMINWDKRNSSDTPFNFFTIEDVFEEQILEALLNEFPNVEDKDVIMGGRQKLDSVNASAWLDSSPTWKSFYNFINDQNTLDFVIDNYSDVLSDWDSNISNKTDIKKDCYVHIDWSVAEDGYMREVHRDSDHRVWNFLIFLNDKQWDGGDFIIHSSDDIHYFKEHFWSKHLPAAKIFEAKKNFGLFFLSTPNSYHSVSLQSNTKEPRKFIYGSITFKDKAFNRRFRSKLNPLNVLLDATDELPIILKKIKRKLSK